MVQTEYHDRTAKTSPLNPLAPEFATTVTKHMEELGKAQTELFNAMLESNRHWLDRVESEAKLASEFAMRMRECRSIPDAVAVCQEWSIRRFEMMADDSKHLLADSQKVMAAGARLLSNRWSGERGG